MNKKSLILISMVLIMSLLLAACGTKDMTKGKTPQEIIEEAYNKQADLKNYEMTIAAKMNVTPPGQETLDISMNGAAVVFQEPQIKMKMNMEMNNPEDPEQNISIEQYMEQTENGMIVYQQMMGNWFKMVIDDPALIEMMNMNPAENTKLFLEYLKEVNSLGEEKLGDKNTIKFEVVSSSEIYDQMLKNMPGLNVPTEQLNFGKDLLSKMGDIKINYWIDKASLDVVKFSMDLTENMKNMAKAMTEAGILPQEAADVFAGMQMSIEFEMQKINAAEDFTIPEEAKNAQEMPMPSQM